MLISLEGPKRNIGVAGCDTWLDPASRFVLMVNPPAPDWVETIMIPAIPQLAGMNITLQAVYVPTDGPMGFDLTNAILAKFGY